MSSDVLVPLAISLGLAVPIVLVLWRVFVVGGDLRRDVQLGRAAVDLARRSGLSIDELAGIVDDLRRHNAEPEAVAAAVHGCVEALRIYSQEAALIDKHVTGHEGEGLQAEVDRAQRAVDLIEHGRQLMAGGYAEGVAEGETSVKRGYINLLHARDAIGARAEAMAAAADPAGAEARRRLRNR